MPSRRIVRPSLRRTCSGPIASTSAPSSRRLTKLLGEYKVKALDSVRSGHHVNEGFERSQFAEAWSRYLDAADSEQKFGYTATTPRSLGTPRRQQIFPKVNWPHGTARKIRVVAVLLI